MMNPNLTLVVQIITMYNEGQERGATVSVCSHLRNTIEALSCFGAAFQPLVLEDLSKMDGNMNAEVYYWSLIHNPRASGKYLTMASFFSMTMIQSRKSIPTKNTFLLGLASQGSGPNRS